ncbi:MAG: hypothetical protein HC933_20085 [Pleurocapsa sp. SU_196_0]|nr:hypothetical protein [Pleurocapsa sp. SU_196_0]
MKISVSFKPTFVLGLGALLALVSPFAARVSARPAYNAIMTYQYDLRDDKELRGTCLYCHTEADGGDLWNPFGEAMREVFFEEGNRRVPETLYETLKRDLDSDKDGYRDILEVIGKSFPGNPKSKPEQSIAALEQKLEDMGGLEAFKPRVAR